MTNNMYFPIYQNLEKEVLSLATEIHFSDDQVNVYSLKIAELIIRCSIEVEAIAKEIYRNETDCEPSKPGDCFAWLEQNFNISKKALVISTPYFHFYTKFSPRFFPFDYENGSENDYYSQYNAIKHDRVKNINKANLNTLLRVLGALFILNIYQKRKVLFLGNDCFGEKIDKSGESKIFNFLVAPCEEGRILTSNKTITDSECLYKIEKRNGELSFHMNYQNKFGQIRGWKLMATRESLRLFAEQHLGQSITIEELSNKCCEESDDPKEWENSIKSDMLVDKFISIIPMKEGDDYIATLQRAKND